MTRQTSRRLAALRGARRRLAATPSPERPPVPEPLPELECPDDDREFVAWSPDSPGAS